MKKLEYFNSYLKLKNRIGYYLRSFPARFVKDHIRLNISAKIQGRHYKIPIGYGLVSSTKPFQERETNVAKVISRLLKERSGSVIDVGANIGQTLLAVKKFDHLKQYIGFEPNPICCSYIEKFCSLNSFTNVTLVSCGLSNAAGILPLYIRDGSGNLETASIVEDFRPREFYNRIINVPVLNGDSSLSLLDRFEEISFIKVDVEGAELQVLSGLSNTLKEKRPPIIFELLPDKVFMTGEKLDREQVTIRRDLAEGIDKTLRSLGYSINRILKDGSISEIGSLEHERHVTLLEECNYLAF